MIKSIYDEFKFFEGRPIDTFAKKAPEPFTLFKKDICPKVEDDYTLGMLNKIWEVYGGYTALHLSEITHLPGSP